MKTCVFVIAGMLIAAIATAQSQKLKEIKVNPPSYKGETPISINEYLQKRIEFPAAEFKWGRQGTVVIGFAVTPEGKLKNFEVINSVSNAIDMEVIRVLKSTDRKWTPGIINGEPAAMSNEISVVFKLYPEDNFIELAKKYMQKGNEALFVKDKPYKALKYFSRGIKLLPNDENLLAIRGLCKYKLGDETGANNDWDRSKMLAKRNGTIVEIEDLAKKPDNSQEYDDMLHTLIK